ncbi:hypothetical protein [Streptomyces caniscabiei]|uniref:Uncharacterized protein n=1 Tax=Streptomyces caniscabiei TaxID=2746961 RepID=A0ABU4MSW5_9ACTN|nr:hypothetical protein [Streptomyces caniscabiei]MDX2954590.1 hypothetical protein [Streptomyces caniscabiei]MDX3039440.1 hypothetical protein [Streptomyces caniscabiei]
MISEFHVFENYPSPFPCSYQELGGLKGDVTVTVLDAAGTIHAPNVVRTWNPDEGKLLEVQVHLDESWAYPAKVTVDWAERPVSSEETTT